MNMNEKMLQMCQEQKELRKQFIQKQLDRWNIRKKINNQHRRYKKDSVEERTNKLRKILLEMLDETDFQEVDGFFILKSTEY
jgi:chemotaxis regulatin CheY-phosphate phosphatase CheZ